MNFGDRLKLVRGHLNQAEFASKTGCHKNTIGRWERGEQSPNIEDINRILEAFPGISPTWLVAGEGPMKGFTAKERVDYPELNSRKRGVPLDVPDEIRDAMKSILDRKLKPHMLELSADKIIIMFVLLCDFYSLNFLENAEYRQETLERKVDKLIELALPEK